MKRFLIVMLALALIAFCLLSGSLAETVYGPNMDWFSAGEAQAAPVPDGLTEREAEIYRQGYAAGHYAALRPAYVEGMYVLNTRTKKFHLSDCKNTLMIDTPNREHFYGTKAEVLDMGYKACGFCKP